MWMAERWYVLLVYRAVNDGSDLGYGLVPWGFRKLLRYIDQRYLKQYPGMELIVTEQVSACCGDMAIGNATHIEVTRPGFLRQGREQYEH